MRFTGAEFYFIRYNAATTTTHYRQRHSTYHHHFLTREKWCERWKSLEKKNFRQLSPFAWKHSHHMSVQHNRKNEWLLNAASAPVETYCLLINESIKNFNTAPSSPRAVTNQCVHRWRISSQILLLYTHYLNISTSFSSKVYEIFTTRVHIIVTL